MSFPQSILIALYRYCDKRDLQVLETYETMGSEGPFGYLRGPHYRALVGDHRTMSQRRLFYNANPKKFGGKPRGWQKR